MSGKAGPRSSRSASERLYPGAEFPREMDICLTDFCNLDCGYCYFHAKSRSGPTTLSPDGIRRALDLYLREVPAARVQKISFSGGEPLTCFDVLLAGLEAVRERLGGGTTVEVFTNGTLLDKAKAKALSRFSPALIVSMDGWGEVCDVNRKFYGGGRGSVSAVLRRNLAAVGRRALSGYFAGATFCRNTAGRLSEGARSLLDAGFRGVIVDLDVTAVWSAEDRAVLLREVRALKRIYAERMEMGFGDVQQPVRFDFIPSRDELPNIAAPLGLREISLSPQGFFFPSGLAATYGPEGERYRIGDLGSGFDYGRMNRVLAELRGYFGSNPRAGYNGCPAHSYMDRMLKKKSPGALMDSGEKLFKALDPVVGPVIEFDLLADALASLPGFGDFSHRPRSVPAVPVRKAEIELSSGGRRISAAAAREALDAALYSPGDFKRLVFVLDGPGCEEDLRLYCAYALMKSRSLGSRLKLYAFWRSGVPGAAAAEFMREHGVDLVLPGAAPAAPGWAPSETWLAAGGLDRAGLLRRISRGYRRFWFLPECLPMRPRTGPGSGLEAFASAFGRGAALEAADLYFMGPAGGRSSGEAALSGPAAALRAACLAALKKDPARRRFAAGSADESRLFLSAYRGRG